MHRAASANRQEPETAYPLGSALGFLRSLWQLNQALEQVSSRMTKVLGVTAQQRLIVRCVGKYPGISAGQLATLLHLDPGTISAAVGRLEQRRLIVRQRDPRDRRRVILTLTQGGRALDRPASGTVEGAVEELLARADAGSLSTTARVLKMLTDRLHAQAALPRTPRASGRSASAAPRRSRMSQRHMR